MSGRWDEELTEDEYFDGILVEDVVYVFKYADPQIDGAILACFNENRGWRFWFCEGDEYDGLIEAVTDEGCNVQGVILKKDEEKKLDPFDYDDAESMVVTRVHHTIASKDSCIYVTRRTESVSYANKIAEIISESE